MKKTFFLTFLIFNFSFLICYASPGEEIETLLSTNAVTYASAARFVLEASDTMVTSDPDEAFRYAQEQKWLPKNSAANDAARLDGVSLLLMRSFGIKGGILYSFTKNAHYAYRELAYKNIIQGNADPVKNVSGEQLLFITGRVFSLMDEEAAFAAAQEQRKFRAEIAKRQKAARNESAASRRTILAEEINAILQRRNIADVTAEATDNGVMLRMSNIQFLADSAVLPPPEKEKLQKITDILKIIPGEKIEVAGHTALAGTVESQLELSRERAQSVATYLIMLGARKKSDVTAIAYGADVPIADNATAEGMMANRRVEIIIMEN
jgi:outer membrane protein OmpA-like peptidoglycan-associated protein